MAGTASPRQHLPRPCREDGAHAYSAVLPGPAAETSPAPQLHQFYNPGGIFPLGFPPNCSPRPLSSCAKPQAPRPLLTVLTPRHAAPALFLPPLAPSPLPPSRGERCPSAPAHLNPRISSPPPTARGLPCSQTPPCSVSVPIPRTPAALRHPCAALAMIYTGISEPLNSRGAAAAKPGAPAPPSALGRAPRRKTLCDFSRDIPHC